MKRIECVSGYRFKPTDEELILDYLMKKAQNSKLPMDYIHSVDNLYEYDPDYWAANKSKLGDNEWYFFTHLKCKYPKGSRPKRSTPNGYWKATGATSAILNTRGDNSVHETIGKRRSLVYFSGTPSRVNSKTNWTMQEFTLVGNERTKPMRLDDWVLCKMYTTRPVKKNTARFNEKSCLDAVSETSPVDNGGIDGNFCTEENGTSAASNATAESIHHIDVGESDAIPHVLQEQINEDLTTDDYLHSGLINSYEDPWTMMECIHHNDVEESAAITTDPINQIHYSIGEMNQLDAIPQTWPDQIENLTVDDYWELAGWLNSNYDPAEYNSQIDAGESDATATNTGIQINSIAENESRGCDPTHTAGGERESRNR